MTSERHGAIKLATAATLAVALLGSTQASGAELPLPTWVKNLIAKQGVRSRTVVEESIYDGVRVFEVLPGDRAADSGDEHVLYSEDGRVICMFGGYAGHVTAGSCNIGKIIYQRTLYPAKPR